MFTGIVEELGSIERFEHGTLRLAATKVLDDIHVGDSIAVNGCCLTVVAHSDTWWEADVSDETISRTREQRNDGGTGGAASNRRSTHATPRCRAQHDFDRHCTANVHCVSRVDATRVWFVITSMNVCDNDRENEADGGIHQSNCVEWVRNYRLFCECDDQSVVDGLVVVASGLVTTSKYSHTYASLMRGRFATRWVRFGSTRWPVPARGSNPCCGPPVARTRCH